MTRRVDIYVLGVLGLAAAYYAAAKIGLRLAYLHGAVTALWPPVGVGIAALALFGLRLWPGVVITDLLVGDYSTPLGAVLGQTAGNTLEVVLGALALRRLVRGRIDLTRVAQVVALVFAAALGTLVSACFGVVSLRLGNVIRPGEAAEVWRTWWLLGTATPTGPPSSLSVLLEHGACRRARQPVGSVGGLGGRMLRDTADIAEGSATRLAARPRRPRLGVRGVC